MTCPCVPCCYAQEKEEDPPGAEPETKSKSRVGLYVGGKLARPKEMVFLWAGAEIKIGVEPGRASSADVDFYAHFVVKVRVSRP
jgi:hypothetical protein